MTIPITNSAPDPTIGSTSGENTSNHAASVTGAAFNPALPSLYRLFDAMNAGDPSVLADTIAEVVTGDFVDHGSPVPLPPGPSGYTQILTFVTSVLRVRYETEDLFATADRIVVRAVGYGRGVAAIHGETGAGKPYAMNTIHIYRTDGDRLAEHWGVRDEAGVLIQLGVLHAPHVSLAAAADQSAVDPASARPGAGA